MTHKGERINWGTWAITSNDPDFGGTGNPDTGADYGPAPGEGRLPLPQLPLSLACVFFSRVIEQDHVIMTDWPRPSIWA